MAREIPTFHDAYTTVERFSARRGVGASNEDIRAAIIDAYQELCDRYPWSYQRKRYRVNIEAPQSTGTVTYDSDANTLEIDGGTWPTTAIDWTVLIDNVTYDIASYTSSTVVTLDTTQKPTSDIAAGTSFEIYRRYYTLPDDFVAMSDPMPGETSSLFGVYLEPDELFARMRREPGSGQATAWTVAPILDTYSRMGLYLQPPHSTAETLDIWYRSQPRPLRYVGTEKRCSAGTIDVVADSAVVAGTSTTFENAMEGSIFRIGDHGTYQPTGLRGARPWVEQRSILTYTSATAVTLDAVVATSQSTIKYTVTDPIDIDPAASTALLRMAERNLSQALGGRDVAMDVRRAEEAIQAARGASNRTSQRSRVAGVEASQPRWPDTSTYTYDS